MLLKTRPGALLLDVLIGVAVFGFVMTGVITAMIISQRGMLASGDRVHGVLLNQQALEAARSVRDEDFAALTEGIFGFQIGEDGKWDLSGTGVTTADGFTTALVMEEQEGGAMRVTATTTWNFGQDRGGTVYAMTELTDWRTEREIGNWAAPSLEGAYVDEGTPLFNSAAVAGDFAFVTSEISDGGAGLYVFDISDPDTLNRIATGFDLGHAGYGVVVAGGYLYVVTDDSSAEVHVYDIADPASLNTDDRVSSINVAGTANARALALFGDTLFVAAEEDAGESELFAYDISTPASPVLRGDLEDDGSSFVGIALRDGYTYLANTSDTAELRVVDVFDPANTQLAPGGGYNAADTPDANAVVAAGGYILLARNAGEVTEELHLFDVSASPVPTSAPWNHEVGAAASALAADPTASYGFVATANNAKEFIVVDIARFAAGQNPEIASYNTATGVGRGVTYSLSHDRVFLMTNTAFIILKPA